MNQRLAVTISGVAGTVLVFGEEAAWLSAWVAHVVQHLARASTDAGPPTLRGDMTLPPSTSSGAYRSRERGRAQPTRGDERGAPGPAPELTDRVSRSAGRSGVTPGEASAPALDAATGGLVRYEFMRLVG